jgi:plasmid stabilization system protein ParE
MKIRVTKRANQDFLKIQDYLITNWGDSSVVKFKNQVNDFLDILEIFPEIGTLEVPEKNIRGFQINSHIRIFYTVKSDSLVILCFFNVLQNSEKKNLGNKN